MTFPPGATLAQLIADKPAETPRERIARLVAKQTDLFLQGAPEADRIAVLKEIQQVQAEIRKSEK